MGRADASHFEPDAWRYLTGKNMRTAIVIALLLGVIGCTGKPSAPPASARAPQRIRVMVEKYSGRESTHVPLGKCAAVVYPPIIKEIPSFLGLLQEALRNPPVLTPDDDIWVCVTPKRQLLAALDFVKRNNLSQRTGNRFSLSFDFVQYAGPIEEHPGNMLCVIGFHLGKLPKGTYKVSIMNSFLQYQSVGKESEAKLVPKTKIHPDTFWYETEFAVK